MKDGNIIIAVLTGLLILTSIVDISAADQAGIKNTAGSDHKQGCTIIYASDGTTALAGNNEDWTNPFPIIWFLPAEDGKYGRVYFGFETDWPQGGMNEKGLFYDAATAENVEVLHDSNKRDYEGSLICKAMEECSTVDEVLKVFTEYNSAGYWNGHYLVGDRFGNSAIIEPLTFIRKTRKYQIVTNFFQSKTDPETSDDSRYRLASDLFRQSDKISIDLFRRILNDTHAEDYGGSWNVTLYTNICDLVSGDIYIYNFHNYDNEVKFNMHDELKKGRHTYLISSLFPYETQAARQFKNTRVAYMLYEKATQNGVSGEDGAIAFYRDVNSKEDTLTKFSLGEEHLNAVGYALLRQNKVNEAIELFSFMVEEFPTSANAWDSRGEAYMKAGNNELAMENYRKSLELNPDNENARKMLEQLQK